MKYIIIVVILLAAVAVPAQDVHSFTEGCLTNPPDFGKITYDEADRLVRSEHRKVVCTEYITNLVFQLQSGELKSDNKVLAIYLLGCLRPQDTNSIEVLVMNIDFQASVFDLAGSFPRWGKYPAEDALIKIGASTVEPLLSHLANKNTNLRRRLMCEVLKKVEAKDAAEKQIDQRIQSESDLTRQANFKLALKELEN
jgi:hypothetical protein